MEDIKMKKALIIVAASCFALLGMAQGSLMDGLVAYWPLDGDIQPGGTVPDMSTGGHDGVLVGNATSVPGVLGEGLAFDGTGGKGVNCGTWNPSESTGQLSLSIWAKWNGTPGDWQGIIGKRDAWQSAGRQIEYCWFAEIAAQAETVGFQSTDNYVGLGNMEIGVWTHVAVSFDGTTAITYRDGVEVGRGAFILGDKLDAHILLAACNYNNDDIGNNFNGTIDEAALWERALSPQEIAELYNNGQGTQLSNPWRAVNPVPASGAVEVNAAGTTLRWAEPEEAAPGPIVKYNVHVSADVQDLRDPNDMSHLKGFVGAAGPLQLNLLDADLAVNTTYYWRVDTLLSNTPMDPNNAYGSIWSFTTQWTKPIIQTQPRSVFVEAGTDAVFSVGLRTDLSLLEPVSYAWYDENDQLVAGATTSQLTISDVGPDELGKSFYCVASNADGSATSDAATLTVKLLVAHYMMDDIITTEAKSVLDASGLGHDGLAAEGVASTTTGIDGGALQFDANGWVDCGTWNPSDPTGQLTVAFWANWGGSNGSWQSVISKRDSWETQNFYWIVTCNDQDGGRLAFGGGAWPGFGDHYLPIGQWAHLAITFDGANATMYMNGAQVGGPAAYQFGGKSDAHIYLGAANAWGDLYKGLLDEVRIYNYALDDVAVARLYAKLGSGSVCPASQRPVYDYDGDCRVGIGDIAMFIGEWLDCYAVPGCLN
jgi:hypothetical protein